jgi:DnaJ-class molecular chaperone
MSSRTDPKGATAEGTEDHYAMLGIDARAGDAEVRRAWRRLAVRWHPDRAGATATATFQRIAAAYRVLSDPAARESYDRLRAPSPRREAPAVMIPRLSGPLNALLACGVARRAADGLIELHVSDREAAHGGMAAIPMRVPVRCPDCEPGRSSACARCGGTALLDELYSAWLAVPPDVADGTVLEPSAQLPGVLRPIYFRVRRSTPR